MTAVILILILSSLAFAQVQSPESEIKMGLKVQEIVTRMDDGSSSDRDTAEAELISLGPAALSHLPVVDDSTSEAMRSRLLRVREALEAQTAKVKAVPSRVTLEGKMKLSSALEKIQEQTGNRVLDNRGDYGQDSNDPSIETDLKDVTFWEALDVILDRAGMVLDPYVLERNSTGFVARQQGQTSSNDRVAHSGRFRFEPLRTESFRDLRNPDSQSLRLGMEISWEPTTAPLALTFLPGTVTAVDEEDNEISVAGYTEPTEIAIHESGSAVEIDIPFELPETKSQKIAKLTGKMEALVPGHEAIFEFDDLTTEKPQTKSSGGVSLTLRRVNERQNLIHAWILVRVEDADQSLQSHRGWVYNNPAVLIAPDGTKHEYVGMDTFRQEDTEFGITYQFDLTGDLTGYKFRYETPAAVLSIPFEYELSDIRLP